ncbi:MAG: ATP-binding protein [Paludibacteraceae bacterium]|nr:ATP-binding protein [Paludibacteraceae bacterium]MBO7234155.1 ATP-binding protein [Paludibacteraceae bacterium]MBO7259460.1 ATP-binding protein [Paludibacteraceae bacterium]
MDSFIRTHRYLVEHVESPVRRQLMDEVDWSHRLIGIKGSRGVGKTTFLLQYAKERFGTSPQCLYINFNNFYFTQHTLVEFAGEFYRNGGRTLLIDQTFKYENWSKELRQCYDLYPELQIIFSGSSVMRLIDGNADLMDVVKSYNLRGFSFREYLNLQAGTLFPAYSLEDILKNHERIAADILQIVKPLWYFPDYLHHGFYPFFLENRNYSENLLKTMNMMLEVDILLIKQIELKYLSKIRKLLHILMNTTPCSLNVSQLSVEIETSRATIMNYIKYLQDARLLNLLYPKDGMFPKKPSRVFLHNTNLLYAVSVAKPDELSVMETYLYNMLHSRYKVYAKRKGTTFSVNDHDFCVYASDQRVKKNDHVINAISGLEIGHKNNIPLWLFGFLY